ncbi:hypothetical protein ACHAWO_013703 [Cyclotella atomus]|uniref:Tesmin/TSO1-like CXC domain-containing protein n=1 Tax=Cyclotella atomus TaxID=382360 RepID=A0ABD3PA42_9STRA
MPDLPGSPFGKDVIDRHCKRFYELFNNYLKGKDYTNQPMSEEGYDERMVFLKALDSGIKTLPELRKIYPQAYHWNKQFEIVSFGTNWLAERGRSKDYTTACTRRLFQMPLKSLWVSIQSLRHGKERPNFQLGSGPSDVNGVVKACEDVDGKRQFCGCRKGSCMTNKCVCFQAKRARDSRCHGGHNSKCKNNTND